MKSRWLSPRAISLHLAVIGWIGGCSAAAYWQVGRAFQGNSLSFMYSVEWPVFGILGVFGWWALLHAEEVSDGKRKARLEYEQMMRDKAQQARQATEEDPDLAAYNDHLASLQGQPRKKLLGH